MAEGEPGSERARHHHVGEAAELGIDGLSEVAVVGSGSSSTVYRARQQALHRTVAVKVIHASWSIETRERFDHEREVMGRLSGHSAIVPILETGITKRGEPYLMMPFYERGSLFRLMKDRGSLPWREATFIVESLARTVAEIHDEGVVHRDLKPGNVLLTNHLQPRLVDFGITLPAGSEASSGAVAYTPSYSPPEAFAAGVVQPTVDVYSLGATLWALLAGRAPFTVEPDARPGQPVDVSALMERSRHADLERPSAETPEPVHELIARAMSKRPEQRPQTGSEFVSHLRQAVRLSEPNLPAQQGSRARRDSLIPAALAVMIAVGLVLVLGGAVLLLTR